MEERGGHGGDHGFMDSEIMYSWSDGAMEDIPRMWAGRPCGAEGEASRSVDRRRGEVAKNRALVAKTKSRNRRLEVSIKMRRGTGSLVRSSTPRLPAMDAKGPAQDFFVDV